MGKNNILILLFLSLLVSYSYGQPEKYGYRVSFTDKNNSAFSVENPEQFLSERAINRRIKNDISIIEADLPVNQKYIDSLVQLGGRYYNSSKWMNSAVFLTDVNAFDSIASLCSFVSDVQLVYINNGTKSANASEKWQNESQSDEIIWGATTKQLQQCNATFLHELGYMGQGIQVAVLDGGFFEANINPGFDSLFLNNQILGTHDFVAQNADVYDDHTHGIHVLSIMGGNIPGNYLGSGPKASFWLLRTENTDTEYLIEEENWIAGAEFADSVGCDIITASLGYSEFDDPQMNHSYSDLDGRLRITQAAEMAFDRGILVINSAGNSGNEAWHYITSPSEGEHVLAIGAVDSLGIIAAFSSRGPTPDGRVKPDVVARGVLTQLINYLGDVTSGNGTSYSCPLVTGLAASLWSAFPDKTNRDIYDAIQYSGNRHANPDSNYGYGIPDFKIAYNYLKNNSINESQAQLIAYPNPFKQDLILDLSYFGNQTVAIEVFDVLGAKVLSQLVALNAENMNRFKLADLNNLNRGLYFLSIVDNSERITLRIVKQ